MGYTVETRATVGDKKNLTFRTTNTIVLMYDAHNSNLTKKRVPKNDTYFMRMRGKYETTIARVRLLPYLLLIRQA